MKVVPAVIAEVKRIREIFLDHHGVPISQEFVDFANAIGNLCDAALALALAAAAVDVPVEAQGKPDARPVIGPNTHRGEDGSVSVLGTSTGVDARPVTDEQKRECVEWLKGYMLSRVYKALSGNAEEIVTHILNRLAPTAGRDK